MDYMSIPGDFYKLHKLITLVTDVVFIKNVPLLLKMYLKFRGITDDNTLRITARNLTKPLIKLLKFDAKWDFIIRTILVDVVF